MGRWRTTYLPVFRSAQRKCKDGEEECARIENHQIKDVIGEVADNDRMQCYTDRSRGQMLCCDCSSSCCIFNDALLFCINLEFVKLTTHTNSLPLREAARVLSDCEKAAAFPFFFFFLPPPNKSAADTHGNAEFSCLPPRWCPTLQGVAFTRSPVCQALCNR